MALPDNSHHVHSDGYYSEKGSMDEQRMLRELSDEIEQIDGVLDVLPDVDLLEVVYNGEDFVYRQVELEVEGWPCVICDVGDERIDIRPR